MRRRGPGGAILLLLLVLGLACSSDDGPLGPEAEPLIGTWDATSFSVDGFDIVADRGLVFVSFFDDATYLLSVSGDIDTRFCDTTPSCVLEGDFTVRSGAIVFDPGTEDEVSLSFTVTGNTLTISGTFDGSSVAGTFEKR